MKGLGFRVYDYSTREMHYDSFLVNHNGGVEDIGWDGDIGACVLMRSTGVQDKHGKVIYEDDLVRLYRKGVYQFTTEVVWNESGLNWNIYPPQEEGLEWEVIYNLHEGSKEENENAH